MNYLRLTFSSLSSLAIAGRWQPHNPPSLYIFIKCSTRELASIEKYVVWLFPVQVFFQLLLISQHEILVSNGTLWIYYQLTSTTHEKRKGNHWQTLIHLSITYLFLLAFCLMINWLTLPTYFKINLPKLLVWNINVLRTYFWLPYPIRYSFTW